ncbi:hypothetical protein OF83DRAFT_1295765 [Amylostereum chailletii]|nr:hypothetical protein OF83DRAFT_1295765 [Amylostereum chailletii]
MSQPSPPSMASYNPRSRTSSNGVCCMIPPSSPISLSTSVQKALAELSLQLQYRLKSQPGPQGVVDVFDALMVVQKSYLDVVQDIRDTAARSLVATPPGDADNTNNPPSEPTVLAVPDVPAPVPDVSSPIPAVPDVPAPAHTTTLTASPTTQQAPLPPSSPSQPPATDLELSDEAQRIRAQCLSTQNPSMELWRAFTNTFPASRQLRRQGAFIGPKLPYATTPKKDNVQPTETATMAQHHAGPAVSRAPKRQREDREAEMSSEDEDKQEGPSNKRARKNKTANDIDNDKDGESKKPRRSPRTSRGRSPSAA